MVFVFVFLRGSVILLYTCNELATGRKRELEICFCLYFAKTFLVHVDLFVTEGRFLDLGFNCYLLVDFYSQFGLSEKSPFSSFFFKMMSRKVMNINRKQILIN